jgi:hypothetical protein
MFKADDSLRLRVSCWVDSAPAVAGAVIELAQRRAFEDAKKLRVPAQ